MTRIRQGQKHASYLFLPISHYPEQLTIIIELDVWGQRLIRRGKDRPSVLQEGPLDTIRTLLLFPPAPHLVLFLLHLTPCLGLFLLHLLSLQDKDKAFPPLTPWMLRRDPGENTLFESTVLWRLYNKHFPSAVIKSEFQAEMQTSVFHDNYIMNFFCLRLH